MAQLVRSWMFVPGHRQRFLDKLAGLGMDAAILDLEDGVLPESKPLARDQIAAFLAGSVPASGDRGMYVRVNEVGSPWFTDDVDAVVQPALTGLVLPKVESAGQVVYAAHLLNGLESRRGLEKGSLTLVLALESASAVLLAPELARSSDRVTALLLGAEDLALDIGLSVQRAGESRELLYARSALVFAARSAGIHAVDGVYPDFQDEAGLLEDASQARRLGFAGKTLFHPSQIERINEIFSATEEERAYARRVVDAFEKAAESGDGCVAVGGQLVDLPIVQRAYNLLVLPNPMTAAPLQTGGVTRA
jgi:citrate lyase subunit beta/citryl-CoA lyase